MDIDFSRYPFDTDENFLEFQAKLQRRLELNLLFERISNCPRKKRTNMHYEEVVHVLPQSTPNTPVLNLNVSEPENSLPRIRLEDDQDHGDHSEKAAADDDQDHAKNPKKRIRRTDKDSRRNKKAKTEGPEPPPETPRWLRDKVEAMGGHGERLLIQKKLSDSDLKSGQNRISMPVLQLRGPDDFLTEGELWTVLRRKDDKAKHFEGLDVAFVEPGSRRSMLSLRKWDYGKNFSYVFAGKNLKDFVKRNGLKIGDMVQIRFFRCGNGVPFFAIVNLAAETASSSSSSSSAQENQAPAAT